MKIRHLILSGLAVAAMGFAAMGCNENPTTPDGNGNLSAPTNLQAVSMSSTSVGLKWTASPDSGAITYNVSWSAGGSDSGSVTGLTATSYTANNLSASKSYVFSVRAMRGATSSSAATITWAGAQRYGTTTTIRMYEKQSTKGSGLVLDPSLGGPLNVKLASPPNPNSVQLAIYTVSATSDSFSIGPAYAFIEYRGANTFDPNVYISDSSYLAQSMNAWYTGSSIDNKIPTNGNVRAFDFPVAQSGGFGQGFFVRTGSQGNYHYARIFVKNVGGNLLQDGPDGRFVEVEISYQQTANLPYAKPGAYSPANVASTTGH